jgi:hypothetical protein
MTTPARWWTVLAVTMTLAGCAKRSSGLGAVVAGGASIGVGALLIGLDDTPECMEHPHCPWFPSGQVQGGVAMIGVGILLLVIGGLQSDADEEEVAPPPAANTPLVVDPTKKDTPKDRAALQASLAARRGDCPVVYVAMDQVRAHDALFYERLRTTDATIAQCMLALPDAR